MRFLLDTHIVIWALSADRRLTLSARELLAAPANRLFVSSISIVEIAIKRRLGRVQGAPPFSGAEALKYCTKAGYELLDLMPSHAAVLDTLPTLHKDPFDRLLIAQALAEPLKLVTHDACLAPYGDAVVLV